MPGLMVSLSALALTWRTRSARAELRGLYLCAYGFFLLALLTNLLAAMRATPLAHLYPSAAGVIEGFAGAVVVCSALLIRGLERVGRPAAAALLGSTALGAVQLSRGRFLFDWDYPYLARFTMAGIPDANYSALYLLMLLAIVGTYAMTRPLDPLTVVALVAGSAALLFTFSRTGWILACLMAAGAVLLGYRAGHAVRSAESRGRRRAQTMRIVAVLGVLLLGLGVALQYSIEARHRIALEIDRHNGRRLSGGVNTLDIREENWQIAWAGIGVQELLVGNGEIDIPQWLHDQGGSFMTLHNLPLTLLVRYGIAGPAAYLAILLFGIAHALRRKGELSTLTILFAGTYGCFTLLISDGFTLWSLTALGLCAYHLAPAQARTGLAADANS